ncbi:hypothetical protein E5S69_29725 [Cupriavidus necator]|uniref:hypothetical protein n=1 Tax=Cupriavidus necator TaxID=106590 RepID=UPI00148F4930|nr:hypothetical protein [Cupriavidus necator]NOV27667.1 hypothetical protein [Cupriavidus necator]
MKLQIRRSVSSQGQGQGLISVYGKGAAATFWFGSGQQTTEDEAERNARLFAAAPELLAALKDLLPACRVARDIVCERNEVPAAMDEAIERAGAAIAKAEGRA